MSLRALFEDKRPSPSPQEDAVAIAFAFDADYIEAFKVFITSLYIHNSFLDSKVIVYTDDDSVSNDLVVSRVADQIKVLDGDCKNILHGLAKNNVRRPERHKWNKGTFLKWMVFEEHAEQTVIFFDVDMLAIRNINEIASLQPSADFVCAPQFKPQIYKNDNGSSKSSNEVAHTLQEWLGQQKPDSIERRVNSGLMILRRSTLSRKFFEEITDFASGELCINEQSHITKYFSIRNSERIAYITPRYNFQEMYLSKVSWNTQRKFLSEIAILHYAGRGGKPWSKNPANDFRPSLALWHWYRSECDRLLENRT